MSRALHSFMAPIATEARAGRRAMSFDGCVQGGFGAALAVGSPPAANANLALASTQLDQAADCEPTAFVERRSPNRAWSTASAEQRPQRAA